MDGAVFFLLGLYMNKLEEEGEAIWQLRMADELLPTANAWWEDCELPALSREEFASQVELQSVHIETKEKGACLQSNGPQKYRKETLPCKSLWTNIECNYPINVISFTS